jgi:restriction endonuclease S subunit
MRKGWAEYKFKDIASVAKGKLPKDKNEGGIGIPYLTANYLRTGIADFWIQNSEGTISADDGDCLVLWDGAGAGDLFRAPQGIVSSTMAVIKPTNRSILREFLTLYVSSKASYIKETCRGTTVPHVSPDAILNMDLRIPPLQEQKRIVDLISSVDSYINALQQQAGTARKSRNAVLHELLSAGGDGWVETTLGEVADWGSGGTPKADNAAYYYGEIPWCVIGDLTESDVWETEKKITQAGLEKSSAKIIQPGSVLLAMYGASIGRTGISAVLMATNQAIAFASVHESRLINRFLLIYLQTQKSRFIESGQGAAQPNISQTIIKSWPITLPPVITQNEIVDLVTTVENVCIGIEQALAKARYLRSALLADLLSGDHEIPASYDKIMGVA